MTTLFISPKNESRSCILTAHSKIDDSFVATMVTGKDLDNIANNIAYCDLVEGKFFFDQAKLDSVTLAGHKQLLIEEVYDFFKSDSKARLITIRNCHPQPIYCNQTFVNNLNSATDQANAAGIYRHKILDSLNLGIIDEATNKLLCVGMTLDTLVTIRAVVELRRGYCYAARLWHNTKINCIDSLEGLAEHKAKYSSIEDGVTIWSGDSGEKYIPPPTIKVNNGSIVSKEAL